jgi:hypothetical protein
VKEANDMQEMRERYLALVDSGSTRISPFMRRYLIEFLHDGACFIVLKKSEIKANRLEYEYKTPPLRSEILVWEPIMLHGRVVLVPVRDNYTGETYA